MQAGYKMCVKCEHELPTTQFCKMTRAKDGLQSYCRTCSSASSAMSHGQSRSDKADLRKLMDEGELAYRYAVAAVKIKYTKELARLKKKYEIGGFDIDSTLGDAPQARGMADAPGRATAERLALFAETTKRLEIINGKTKGSEAKGAENEPVRSAESSGVPNQ